MKNKIYTAMLLGMSATMAVPGTAVFAAENAAEVVTETAAEVQEENIEEETVEEASEQVEEPGEAPTLPAENPEPEEDSLLGENTPTVDYATNPEAKAADTPDGFEYTVREVQILPSVFGDYCDAILDYLCGEEINVSSLYDCEMDMMKKLEEIASDESKDTVNAMKYQMALQFELKFGENAFQAGRDVRRSIVTDKDDEFALCMTIADVDSVYTLNGGITTIPETVNEDTPSDAPSTETSALAQYVQGMEDIHIVVGTGEVPTPACAFDSAFVKSVTVNTTNVNPYAIGDYDITYVITGVDGTTESVVKKCFVEQASIDESVKNKIYAKIDAVNDGSLTEKEFQDKWAAEAQKLKDKVDASTDEDAIATEAFEKFAAIVAEQQLYIAKKGYVNIITSYITQLTFKTDAQKAMAEEVKTKTIEKINAAETVDEAAKALAAGKSEIEAISKEDESSITALKEKVKEKLDVLKAGITDNTEISVTVYDVFVSRINTCTTATELSSVETSANIAFGHVKTIVGGDLKAMIDLHKALKGIATSSDATSTIDLIIGLEPTEDMSEAESRIKDACMALSCEVEEFTKYLSAKTGKEINGTTKAELYADYIKIITDSPNKELEKLKVEAKTKIENALAEVDESYEEIKIKKEELKADAEKALAEADTEEKINKVVDMVRTKSTELLYQIKEMKELDEVKTKAIDEINKTVDGQESDKLKELIKKVADSSIEAVKSSENEADVEDAIEKFKANVEEITKIFKEDEALAKAKTDTITKLTKLEAQANKSYETEEMVKIMTDARTEIENAKTPDDCESIYTKTKESYSAAYLKGMKAVYIKKLEELPTKVEFNDAYKQKAADVVAKQKENIEKATNEETMQNCCTLAQKQLQKLVELQTNEKKLEQLKANAINALKAKYPNPSNNGSKILESYFTKIKAATKEADITKLVADCNKSMSNSGESNNTTNSLAQAKARAISSLNNMLGSVPLKNQGEARNVLKDYINKINAAGTTEEVNNLLTEGVTALKKYGGNPNDAKPNDNTGTDINGDGIPDYDLDGDGIPDIDINGDGIPDYDLDGDGIPDIDLDGDGKPDVPSSGNSGGGNYATPKGNSSITGTGNVKTGDENMGVIAMAGTAIVAALGAIALTIRKFLRR